MIQTHVPPHLTPEVVFLKGQFALHDYKIAYYTATVPMQFAAREFSLFEELKDVDVEEWSLDELFQRDISWERVDVDLVKYLNNPARPQFFNALTIALLPKRGSGLGGAYQTKKIYQEIAEQGLGKPTMIGGIQLQFYQGSDAGKIRWDVEEVVAVAVDGQHRLAAIKRFAATHPDAIIETQIPVIFLIPDKLAGFYSPQQPGKNETTVSSLRTIFIDLNRNARPVSPTRNILLDDLNVVNVCVRRLIGTKLSAEAEQQRIPLPLVDWITDKNKIETGPFLTTVLLLDDYIRAALEPPVKPTQLVESDDRDAIREWLDTQFGASNEALEELMSQVDKCIASNVPLTWLPSHVAVLGDLFDANWRPAFYDIFRRLHPFAQLWDYRQKNKLLTPEFVNLFSAFEVWRGEEMLRRRDRIIEAAKTRDPSWSLDARYKDPLAYINQNIKGDRWAYKVVFQKALLRSYLELLEQAEEFVGEQNTAQILRIKFTDFWIEAANTLLDSDLGLTKAKMTGGLFWEGSGLQSDGTIEYTKAGADRLQAWLKTWVLLYKLGDKAPHFGKLDQDQAPLTTMINNTFRSKGPLAAGMRKAALPRLSADADEDEIAAEGLKLLQARYNHLRKKVISL